MSAWCGLGTTRFRKERVCKGRLERVYGGGPKKGGAHSGTLAAGKKTAARKFEAGEGAPTQDMTRGLKKIGGGLGQRVSGQRSKIQRGRERGSDKDVAWWSAGKGTMTERTHPHFLRTFHEVANEWAEKGGEKGV